MYPSLRGLLASASSQLRAASSQPEFNDVDRVTPRTLVCASGSAPDNLSASRGPDAPRCNALNLAARAERARLQSAHGTGHEARLRTLAPSLSPVLRPNIRCSRSRASIRLVLRLGSNDRIERDARTTRIQDNRRAGARRRRRRRGTKLVSRPGAAEQVPMRAAKGGPARVGNRLRLMGRDT